MSNWRIGKIKCRWIKGKYSKFDDNFEVRHKFLHFAYVMIYALDTNLLLPFFSFLFISCSYLFALSFSILMMHTIKYVMPFLVFYFPVLLIIFLSFLLSFFYDRGHVTDVFRVFFFLRVCQGLVQVWEVANRVFLKQLQTKRGSTLLK